MVSGRLEDVVAELFISLHGVNDEESKQYDMDANIHYEAVFLQQ